MNNNLENYGWICVDANVTATPRTKQVVAGAAVKAVEAAAAAAAAAAGKISA